MNSSANMNQTSVTVIMRTKNSEDILPQTLKSLFSQQDVSFDLLAVDSGSTDNTLSILKEFPCRIIQIKAEDYFPGKVLNFAISQSSSPLIVFLNSDAVFLTPNALKCMISAFDDPAVLAAFGRQLARPDAELWVKRDYLASFPDSRNAPSWMPLSLVFSAMRRSAWEKHPFYTSAWGSEDTEWGNWAKKSNLKISYLPDALVMHSHNYTFKQLYGRRFIEGEADAFIYHRSYALTNMLWDTIKAVVRDFLFYIRSWHLLSVWKIPILRFIYFWSYRKGNRLGMKRLNEGNDDASKGQKAVLSRYGSKKNSS